MRRAMTQLGDKISERELNILIEGRVQNIFFYNTKRNFEKKFLIKQKFNYFLNLH